MTVLLLLSQFRSRLFHSLTVIHNKKKKNTLLISSLDSKRWEKSYYCFLQTAEESLQETSHSSGYLVLAKLKGTLKTLFCSDELHRAKEISCSGVQLPGSKLKVSWHSVGLAWGPLPTHCLHGVTVLQTAWRLGLRAREWRWTNLIHI